MKTHKMWIAVFAIVFFSGIIGTVAQEHRGKGHWKRIMSELNLSDAQKKEIKNILDENRPSDKETKERQERIERMKNVDEQIKKVLNSEQLKKYEELKKDMANNRRNRKSDNARESRE